MKKEERTKPKRHKNGKWVKGCSGNRNGRPKGALGLRTRALKALVENSAEDVIEVLLESAIDEKNIKSASILLSRILPVIKESPASCPNLPEINKLSDIPIFLSEVIAACKNSEITLSQGESLARLANQKLKSLQYLSLEQEIEKIKEKLQQQAV
jgi:hypothetical protein